MQIKTREHIKFGECKLTYNDEDYYIFMDVEHNTRVGKQPIQPEQISGIIVHNNKIMKVFDIVTEDFKQKNKFYELPYTKTVGDYKLLKDSLVTELRNIDSDRYTNIYFIGQGIRQDIKLIMDIDPNKRFNLRGNKYEISLEKYWKGSLTDNIKRIGKSAEVDELKAALFAGDTRPHHALFDSIMALKATEHIIGHSMTKESQKEGAEIKYNSEYLNLIPDSVYFDWRKHCEKVISNLGQESLGYKIVTKRYSNLLLKNNRHVILNSSMDEYFNLSSEQNIRVVREQLDRYLLSEVCEEELLELISLINGDNKIGEKEISYVMEDSKEATFSSCNPFDVISWKQYRRILSERHVTKFITLKENVKIDIKSKSKRNYLTNTDSRDFVSLTRVLNRYYQDNYKTDNDMIIEKAITNMVTLSDQLMGVKLTLKDNDVYDGDIVTLLKSLYLDKIDFNELENILKDNNILRIDNKIYDTYLNIGEKVFSLGRSDEISLNRMVYQSNILIGKQKIQLNYEKYLRDVKNVKYYNKNYYHINFYV